jgi:hypothetical protein
MEALLAGVSVLYWTSTCHLPILYCARGRDHGCRESQEVRLRRPQTAQRHSRNHGPSTRSAVTAPSASTWPLPILYCRSELGEDVGGRWWLQISRSAN